MASVQQVVWVAQWYPHEGEPYAGDFIQRHARAVALYMPVHLFACFPHSSNQQQKTVTGNLTENISYFKPVRTGLKPLDKILLWRKWNRLLKAQIRQHIKEHGKPDLLHCHITLNAGWLGLWAKKKLGIPYLVTEHWSGYMPGAFNGFEKYNRWSKKLFRKIIQQASCITTVSKALAKAMQQLESKGTYTRIPNVVDQEIFAQSNIPISKGDLAFLHISTFSKQKNMEAMLATFDKVSAFSPDATFHIVGPKAKFQKLFPQQAADSHYVLHGEIPQPQIATLMQQCRACVLYSHYETFGCVLIEANAAGLPVIVSDIPVLREIVQQGVNGVLVQPNNPDALAAALTTFLQHSDAFQPGIISRQAAALYAYPVVGKQFFERYKQMLSGHKIVS